MADGLIRLPPDSTGKHLDTSQITVGGDPRQRQRVSLADSDDPAEVVAVTNRALDVNVVSGGLLPLTSPFDFSVQRAAPRAVQDGVIILPPDSTGKKLDTSQVTVGGDAVQRQRMVLGDPANPNGLVTVVGNALNVNIAGLGGTPLDLAPTNGDVLTYDATGKKWIAKAPPANGGGTGPPPDLSGLLEKTGGTMTGALVLHADPVNDLEAATKQYVDGVTAVDLTDYLKKTDQAADSALLNGQGNSAFATAAQGALADSALTDAKAYTDSAIASIPAASGFVDLTSVQNIGGNKTFDDDATFAANVVFHDGFATIGGTLAEIDGDFQVNGRADFHGVVEVHDYIDVPAPKSALHAANKEYVDDEIADKVSASQFWLPAVETLALLPSISDTSKTWLCRVRSENNVYQCVAGQTAWQLYSENADFLPLAGKAADSALLNGKPDTAFATTASGQDAFNAARLNGLDGDRFYALRGSFPNGADLDTYTAIGIWQSGGTATTATLLKLPGGIVNGVLTLEVHQGQHNQTMMVTQRLSWFSGSANAIARVFTRLRYSTGTWSAWTELLSDANGVKMSGLSAGQFPTLLDACVPLIPLLNSKVILTMAGSVVNQFPDAPGGITSDSCNIEVTRMNTIATVKINMASDNAPIYLRRISGLGSAPAWSGYWRSVLTNANGAMQYRTSNAAAIDYYLKIASFNLAINPPTSGVVRHIRLKVRLFRSSLAYNGEYIVTITLSGVPPETTAQGFVTYTARDIYGTNAQFAVIKDAANNRFDIWCWGRTNFSSLTVEQDMLTSVVDSMTFLPDGGTWLPPTTWAPNDAPPGFVALPQEQTATREWTKTYVPVASTTLQKSNTTSNWIKIAQATYPGMSTSTGNRQVRLQVDTRNGGAIGWSRYILRLRFSTQASTNVPPGVVYGTPAADVTEQQIGGTREPIEFAYVLDDTARVVFIYAFTSANYAQLTVSLADTNSNDNAAITILPDGAGWISPRPFPVYNPPPGGTDTVLTNNVYIPFNPGVVLTNQNGIQQMNVGLPAGTDLNNIRTPGIYGCNSSTIAGNLPNIPNGMGSRYFTLFVYGTVSTGVSGIVTQMLVAYSGTEAQDSTTYTRVLRNASGIDSWSNWTQSNSGIVGPNQTFGIANIYGQRVLGTPTISSVASQQDVIIQNSAGAVGVYSFDLCIANNSYGQVVKRFWIRTTTTGIIDTAFEKSQILEYDSSLNSYITIGEPYQSGDSNVRVPIIWFSGNITYRVSVKMLVNSTPEQYYSLGSQAVAPTGVLRLAQQPNCVLTNTLAFGIPPRSLTTGTDLNTITTVGVYMATSSAIGASIVNAPPGVGQPFRLEVKQTNDSIGNVNQVITVLYTSSGYANGQQFIRSCNAGSWTRWKGLDNPVYSTSEIWTGSYWTDGSPIYRKVVSTAIPAVASGASTIITVTTTGFAKLIDARIVYPAGVAYSTDVTMTASNINLRNGSVIPWDAATSSIVVEYTKA